MKTMLKLICFPFTLIFCGFYFFLGVFVGICHTVLFRNKF